MIKEFNVENVKKDHIINVIFAKVRIVGCITNAFININLTLLNKNI